MPRHAPSLRRFPPAPPGVPPRRAPTIAFLLLPFNPANVRLRRSFRQARPLEHAAIRGGQTVLALLLFGAQYVFWGWVFTTFDDADLPSPWVYGPVVLGSWFLLPTVLPAVAAAFALRSRIMAHTAELADLERACPACGYDLRGLAGEADRCPECGAAVRVVPPVAVARRPPCHARATTPSEGPSLAAAVPADS